MTLLPVPENALSRKVPHSHLSDIVTRRQQLAVRRKCDRQDLPLAAFETRHFAPGACLPHMDGAVLAGGDQVASVGRKSDGIELPEGRNLRWEFSHQLVRSRVPH